MKKIDDRKCKKSYPILIYKGIKLNEKINDI